MSRQDKVRRFPDGTPMPPDSMAWALAEFVDALAALRHAAIRQEWSSARVRAPRGGCLRRLLRLLDLVD